MSESRWQLDDDTIRLGRARIAEIRAQLAERGPTSTRRSPVDESGGSAVSVELPGFGEAASLSWSAERVASEMASGAERDQLRARVDALEAEVVQLRAALAAVLSAAATGLDVTVVSDSSESH